MMVGVTGRGKPEDQETVRMYQSHKADQGDPGGDFEIVAGCRRSGAGH